MITQEQFIGLKPGDIVATPAGTTRTILEKSDRYITLKKIHHSWTGSPTTVYRFWEVKNWNILPA